MTAPLVVQRLTLRAVLRDVRPMVIRDAAELIDPHKIVQAILGRFLDLGYSFRPFLSLSSGQISARSWVCPHWQSCSVKPRPSSPQAGSMRK